MRRQSSMRRRPSMPRQSSMRLVPALALVAAVMATIGAGAPSAPPASNPKLMDPAALNETAPETYQARFTTSKGDFVVEVTRAWAPHGADRFYNLVKNGYYDDGRFFRVVYGFMVQFGINGDPALNAVWRDARITDDLGQQSNKRGFVTFATAGTNTRTTQVFINTVDRNTNLDDKGFVPFGKVVEGMQVVDKLFSGYGEAAPQGHGPDQNRLQKEGNAYLAKFFPKLDYIKTASIVKAGEK
jgi:peptidyl-prolyl cis-trans isomerase A (cyclophilin A)